MRLFKILLIGLSLTISCKWLLAQVDDTKRKLIGSWIYSGLENKIEINADDKIKQDKADKMNAGMTITFEASGKYQIWKKSNNKKEILSSGLLKLTKNGKHLSIEGLEGDIDTLTSEFLKVYYPDRPIMVFKKLKEL